MSKVTAGFVPCAALVMMEVEGIWVKAVAKVVELEELVWMFAK